MKYVRDLEHNYMVFEADLNNGANYRAKMVTRNRVEGLLPVEIRKINGKEYLYYGIDRLQPIANRFASRGMKRADMERMISDLLKLLDELKEVLLGEEGLVFSADSVFTDIQAGKYYFAYLPLETSDGISSFPGFLEELLDYADSSDEEAIDYIYDLCERSGIRGLTIREITGEAKSVAIESKSALKPQFPDNEAGLYKDSFPEDVAGEESFEQGTEIVKAYGKRRKLSLIASFALPALFTAVLLADVYIRASFELGEREKVLSGIVAIVALLSAAGTMLSALKRVFGEDEDAEEAGDAREELYGGCPADKFAGYEEPITVRGTVSSYTEEEGDNATRLLSGERRKRRPKLYGRCGGENVNISLDTLPLVIGKQAGVADVLLKDDTVSRMHARLFKDAKNALTLKDLNSTNGTVINGRRLDPGEGTALKIGDEICFGNMVFEYR